MGEGIRGQGMKRRGGGRSLIYVNIFSLPPFSLSFSLCFFLVEFKVNVKRLFNHAYSANSSILFVNSRVKRCH